MDLSSFPFIVLTAAAIRGADLRYQLMYSKYSGYLELINRNDSGVKTHLAGGEHTNKKMQLMI